MICPVTGRSCYMCEWYPFRNGCVESGRPVRSALSSHELREVDMRGLDFATSLRKYSARAVSDSVALHTGSESSVQQQFAKEVDINTIVRRFGITREMPSGLGGGVYGDFTGITDFDSAVAAVERAQAGFLALDPEVRDRFGNDPGAYLEYVDGLTDEELGPEVGVPAPVAPVEPEPQRVIVVPAPVVP